MKRASAESVSLGNDSGLSNGLAEHIGPRLEDAALFSKLRLDAPAAIETLFNRYHEKVYGLAMSHHVLSQALQRELLDPERRAAFRAEVVHPRRTCRAWEPFWLIVLDGRVI